MKLQDNFVLILAAYAIVLYYEVEAADDLYKILGIKRDATDKQIKRAFRKLALKYHPDKNKDADAKDQFLKIGKAYEILGDPDKRKKYDLYGDDGTSGDGSGSEGFQKSNFDDFFKHFDQARNAHQRGGHYHREHHGGFHNFDFGNSGGFFNFDDLFHDMDSDEETLFFGGNGGGKRGNSGFDFDFGHFGFDDDLFDDFDDMFNFHDVNHHHEMHGQARHTHGNFHEYTQSVHKRSATTHQKRQQRCHQVTQQVGNQVITFTQCS